MPERDVSAASGGGVASTGQAAEYRPQETSQQQSSHQKRARGITASHSQGSGATFRPQYIERNPAMWAVGETDMMALSIAGVGANVSFALGSFFLGFAVNIIVNYGGVEKLTDVGDFMLHKATLVLGGLSLVFYVIGVVMTCRKGALWNRIKKESRLTPS